MTWTPWLAALAPLAYLAASLAPERAFPINRTSVAAGWLSLAAAGAGLAGALGAGAAGSPTLGVADLGLSLRIDALSAPLSVLIGFIGLVVVAYSRNYLAGDPKQGRFTRQLCLTLGLLQGLVLSGNLAQVVACWVAASLCVNRLLLFRAERQAAVLAARKRFLVSRLADLSLIAAAALLWRAAGSGDIGTVLAAARQAAGGPEWGLAGALLALAAVFSSAQLPFHGWILEVMETPTPVSALLHAGVANAGGFLVLRFGAVVAADPAASNLLTIVGAASAVFGSLVMLTQTSVKVSLAYSTIAQMGFMLLECGLGAYSAALLHIVAHALYKAHAFLSAGGAGAAPRAPRRTARAPALAVLAVPALVGLAALAMTAMGAGPSRQPGVFVLSGALLLGLARVWLRRDRRALIAAVLASAVLIPAYVAGQAVFARLTGDLGAQPVAQSGPSAAVAVAVVALMTGLVCLQLRMPGPARSPAWARAYALVSNGFHLNTIANRWVLRLWPAAPSNSSQSGAAA